MKSGKLNFLEPSGPLQSCNETALPFTTYTYLPQLSDMCNVTVKADGFQILLISKSQMPLVFSAKYFYVIQTNNRHSNSRTYASVRITGYATVLHDVVFIVAPCILKLSMIITDQRMHCYNFISLKFTLKKT
jgi:hypothetical protein